jgi:hypothetical protein
MAPAGANILERSEAMDIPEFLSLNVVIVGGVALVLMVYLVSLIRRRRRRKFLHSREMES